MNNFASFLASIGVAVISLISAGSADTETGFFTLVGLFVFFLCAAFYFLFNLGKDEDPDLFA